MWSRAPTQLHIDIMNWSIIQRRGERSCLDSLGSKVAEKRNDDSISPFRNMLEMFLPLSDSEDCGSSISIKSVAIIAQRHEDDDLLSRTLVERNTSAQYGV